MEKSQISAIRNETEKNIITEPTDINLIMRDVIKSLGKFIWQTRRHAKFFVKH